MFLVNSCLGLFTAAPFGAPLLPKLRGQFAEFLNNPSPVGLRILSSSTCVGLRYGRLSIHQSFSRLSASRTSLLNSVPFAQLNQRLGSAICKCPSGLRFGGYGISTVCASTTPRGLALAPGLPWADEPSPGNLRLSMAWILTMLSLLIPAFSLLSRPHILSIMLRPTIECSSTTYIFLCKSAISVYSLAPVIFRATSLDQ